MFVLRYQETLEQKRARLADLLLSGARVALHGGFLHGSLKKITRILKSEKAAPQLIDTVGLLTPRCQEVAFGHYSKPPEPKSLLVERA